MRGQLRSSQSRRRLCAADAPFGRWAPSSPHAVLAEPGQALTPWPDVFTWDGGVGPLHCVTLAQLSTQVHPRVA